jgi:predicted RNA-binding Zn-ribbon protein involved in translation (DUF1610 family)
VSGRSAAGAFEPLEELLRRLRVVAMRADPDAPSRRLAEALDCPECGTAAHVHDLKLTAVELTCPACGHGWAVEVPPSALG